VCVLYSLYPIEESYVTYIMVWIKRVVLWHIIRDQKTYIKLVSETLVSFTTVLETNDFQSYSEGHHNGSLFPIISARE
jgi:hypothetical protein